MINADKKKRNIPNLMKATIEQFAIRPSNWNSYGANPITLSCKAAALELVDLLASQGALTLSGNMTGDSDVVISCRIGDYRIKWQIDADGDIAAISHDQSDRASFYDMTLLQARGFIQDLKDEHI